MPTTRPAVEHRCPRRPGGAGRGVLERPLMVGRGGRGTPASVAGDLAPRGAPAVAAGGHGDDDVAGRDGVIGPRRAAPTSAVSTSRTTRSPSTSLPATVACTARPSAKWTSVVSSRRLWALVKTLPGAHHEARPPAVPSDGDDGGGAAASAVRTRANVRRSLPWPPQGVTIELLVTLDSPHVRQPPSDALDAAARRIGDRWSLRVVGALLEGDRTFGELAARRRRHRADDPHGPAARAAAPVAGHRHPLRPPAAADALRPDRARPPASPPRSPPSPSGAPTGRATATGPVHRACGTPVETRPWCPTCDAPVDDETADDLIWC